jgi:hypothetical protein
MKYKGDFVIIAKDGWPLEQFKGRPIKNFFRRLFLGSHKQCRACLPCMNEQPPKCWRCGRSCVKGSLGSWMCDCTSTGFDAVTGAISQPTPATPEEQSDETQS